VTSHDQCALSPHSSRLAIRALPVGSARCTRLQTGEKGGPRTLHAPDESAPLLALIEMDESLGIAASLL